MTDSSVDPPPSPSDEPEKVQSRYVRRPPGRSWIAAFVGFATVLLWSLSYPGARFDWLLVGMLGVAALCLWWVNRLVVPMEKREALTVPTPWYRRWWIGPLMLVALVVLGQLHVPVRVRFALNKSAFDAVVRDLEPAGSFDDWKPLEVPDEIGGYHVYSAYQVGPNVLLYELRGAFLFEDGGFAYLPDGPDERLGNDNFEAPRFRHLTGDWYTWQASSGWTD